MANTIRYLRTFTLQREGVGVVAEGVEFSDGAVVLRWTSEYPSSVVFNDRGLDSINSTYGSDGITSIVWNELHRSIGADGE